MVLFVWGLSVSMRDFVGTSEDERASSVDVQQGVLPSEGADENKAHTYNEIESLVDWLSAWRESPSESLLEEGLILAGARRARLSKLIPEDPGLAIDSMLRFQDYMDLPTPIAEIIEQPIAFVTDVDAVVSCGMDDHTSGPAHQDHVHYVAKNKGGSLELFLPKEREGLMSKKRFPVMGIQLEGKVALHRSASLALSGEELNAASRLFGLRSQTEPLASRILFGDRWLNHLSVGEADLVETVLSHAEKRLGLDTVTAAVTALESGVYSPNEVSDLVSLASDSWTQGDKRILIVRAAFSDQGRLVRSKEELELWARTVSSQFSEMSYGKTQFSVIEVTESVYALPYPKNRYEASENWFSVLHADVEEILVQDKIFPSDFDVTVVVTPPLNVNAIGLASVGGGKQWIADSGPGYGHGVMRHEFGHNYGLWHASSWDAKDGSIMPEDVHSEFHQEYGDRYDYMGSSSSNDLGDFNVFEKERLGWVTRSSIKELNGEIDEVFRVYRFDHPDTAENKILALKLKFERSETFWVMFRKKFSENENLSNGAYVLWQHQSDKARLLDMHPETYWMDNGHAQDEALSLGSSFADPTGAITISTVGIGGGEGDE